MQRNSRFTGRAATPATTTQAFELDRRAWHKAIAVENGQASFRSSVVEARCAALAFAACRGTDRRRRPAIGPAAIATAPVSGMAAIAGAAAISGILDDRGDRRATAIIIAVRARVDMCALIDAARGKRSKEQNWSES